MSRKRFHVDRTKWSLGKRPRIVQRNISILDFMKEMSQPKGDSNEVKNETQAKRDSDKCKKEFKTPNSFSAEDLVKDLSRKNLPEINILLKTKFSLCLSEVSSVNTRSSGTKPY